MGIAKLLGWIGTIAYLVAYFLLCIKKIKAEKPLYHLLNIIGALGLIFNAWSLNDYPNLAVNIIWALIAFYAIFLIAKKSNHNV